MSPLVERVLHGALLAEEEAAALFDVLVDPATPPVVLGALLGALRARGETAEEIRGLARAMRRAANSCPLPGAERLVDVVGTGGDGSGSLNLSTGSALLAAAAGARVAKHGAGAASSRTGSADVLSRLLVALPESAEEAGALLQATGFTFLLAPAFHPVLRHAAPLRRALGTRTVFNLLGPLANPASPPFAVVGAHTLAAARAMAEALAGLGVVRAFVIHGENGWDEPTPVAPFALFDVRSGSVAVERRDPRALGFPRCAPEALRGGDPSENAEAIRRVFAGERGGHRDALVLGAALALEVCGLAADAEAGTRRAAAAIDGGAAGRLLGTLAAASARVRA